MSARILYTQAGNDPAKIVWPPAGHPSERWEFESGKPREVDGLFTHGDGSITVPDGREFPRVTPEGSTFALVDSLEAEAPPVATPPSIEMLTPSSAVLPSADVMVGGANFTETSVVVFGGVDQDTTFVSDLELEVTLTAEVAGDYEVLVRDDAGTTGVLSFTFTEAASEGRSEHHRRPRH